MQQFSLLLHNYLRYFNASYSSSFITDKCNCIQVFGPTDPVVTGEESDEEVTGEASAMADDAKSIASCPVGKVITKCESFTGLLESPKSIG